MPGSRGPTSTMRIDASGSASPTVRAKAEPAGPLPTMSTSTCSVTRVDVGIRETPRACRSVLGVALGHDERAQCAVGDHQAGADALGVATPDRVLVLDGEHAVEPALVQRVDETRPVDLAQARHAVAPPPGVPGVGSRRRLAEEPVAI